MVVKLVSLLPLLFPLFSFEGVVKDTFEKCDCVSGSLIVGIDDGEDPPVPIPNTEVKLTCAENTWGAAPREDR